MKINRKTYKCKDCDAMLTITERRCGNHICKTTKTKQKTIELLESYSRMLKDDLFVDKNKANGRWDLYDQINKALVRTEMDNFEFHVIQRLFFFIDSVLEGKHE